MMEKLNRFEKLDMEGGYLTTETTIKSDNIVLENIVKEIFINKKMQEIFSSIKFIKSIDEMLEARINNAFGNVYEESKDGYVIEADEELRVYAASTRGLIYGACTIQQIAKNGFVRKGIIYNKPVCSFRGLKVYLPAEENIDFFKEFVDMACYYRYNTIIMEVGGAMEYKRHPEINEGWVEYCKEMCEYSGKAIKVQHDYNWEKNSIHCDNGGGNWLSQEKVGMMVGYCKERGLDVIPEVPCLSHCDYMLIRHPELAERSEDPFPDTYCPSNPSSHDLLFDILEEVIEVFKPRSIHVGHDEFYSFGLCEKCKDKDAADIFVDDLKVIHKYLTERSIETMIWGDKLLNFIDKKGVSWGGAARAICDNEGRYKQFIPPTYKAIGMVPENIKIMNWYWSFDRDYDKDYLNHQLYMVYGNLEGPAIPEWSKRISNGAV